LPHFGISDSSFCSVAMRRSSLFRCVLPALCGALLASAVGAQASRPLPRARDDTSKLRKVVGTIDGFVTDTALAPVHAAFVTIFGTPIRIGTGPNGRFRIANVPSGQYLVIVKRVGYRPISAVVEVPPSDTLRLAYTMETVPANMLDAVVVSEKSPTMRMREFDARKKLGVGQFLDRDQIERANTVYATELFRKFLSLTVSPSRTTSMTEYYALSTREGGNLSLGACPMQILLDQVPLPTPFNLDLLPPPKEIAGIEVYSGPSTTPPQFAGPDRSCGVVLVWTRDR
jgi:hypothetical protein